MSNLPLIPRPDCKTVTRDFDDDKHVEWCFFCNRPLTLKGIKCFVEMTTTQMMIPVGYGEHKDSQGCYPAGSTCMKKVPKGYRLTKKHSSNLWASLGAA